MATVLLKTGEFREIPDDQLISFLQENQDLIQNRQSPRKRAIKRPISTILNYKMAAVSTLG
ncbi:hypothetical protein MSj_00088 [Microcystis aeruginosa Sj]|uniref:Uncharacterized protein n=1 Tax=Microcystis aeruginosa Sj TaxID=1979544 RepID=A0A2Z6UD05_MICAE|nr:hypothetical protein [Microcystis aeruginosa]GBL08615.1 hypothetical protein MSj_00088 [Microcystis aeruginosa Sj]